MLLRTDAAYRGKALAFLGMTPKMRTQRTLIDRIRSLHASGKVPTSVRIDVVDAGCGSGPDLDRFLKAELFRGQRVRAIGLDRVSEMLEVAREHFSLPGASLVQGCMTDFGKLFPNNGVVAIWCRSALFNVPAERHPSILEQFYASLIPEGILFLRLKVGQGVLNREDGRQEKLYEKLEISAALKTAGFQVGRIVNYKDELGRSDVSWMGVWASKPPSGTHDQLSFPTGYSGFRKR